MKVNILLDPTKASPDALNIHPEPPADAPGKWAKALPHQLESVLDRGEVDELVARGILDHFSLEGGQQALAGWVSLLARSGTLTLEVVDTMRVARALLDGELGIVQYDELVHGGPDMPPKKSSWTAQLLVQALQLLGLKVIRCRTEDVRLVVVGQRP